MWEGHQHDFGLCSLHGTSMQDRECWVEMHDLQGKKDTGSLISHQTSKPQTMISWKYSISVAQVCCLLFKSI